MKQFEYTITDPLGIHARPAGMLAKTAKGFADTTVTVAKKDGAAVKASQLMKLMSLGIKQGDVVTVAADGPSEDAAIAAMQAFFQENL
ncbi:MAG: HPr family phosphocarrier protein [Oscillibacter sp.]|nr:HPr family phosphocarrier protein [Oscillibacter sp.]